MKSTAVKALNPRNTDTKYMGDEPNWINQPETMRATALSRAFGWYNYFYSKKEARDLIADFLERKGLGDKAKKVRAAPDSKIVLTTGWLCRMSDRGLILTEQEQTRLDQMIADIVNESVAQIRSKTAVVDTAAKPNIQDRLRERVSECAGELEGLFDSFIDNGTKITADFKPLSTMRSMNVAPQMIGEIKTIWQRRQQEFETVLLGKDSQLVEGYRNLSKTQLKNCVKFCELVVGDCGAYVQIKKVERKPRKVKPISPEKRAAKFKVMMAFADLKLTGLPAAQLVDKSEAWLYDTKKRKLIHLVADDHTKTFTVKNNTVIGFSTTQTVQKTIRKPSECLKSLMASGKPNARKIFKDVRATETAWNGRGSENLMILRVW